VLKGECSYYADKFHGRKTANGEIFDMHKMTAAHKQLPFNTIIEVENLENNKKVTVRINDRGPFKPGRIIDLSYAAAKKIDLIKSGTAQIKAKIIKLGTKKFFY
jgi:rare lipoprotein A